MTQVTFSIKLREIKRLFGVSSAKKDTSDFASNLMKIEPYIRERSAVIKRNSVVIGPLKKESVTLDSYGNEIDRRTKQIIKLAGQ